ncbi:A disintegrin and metalloproteinase with thrombospondin motifs adt-1-like [Dysidea avara]|uniref:A disintegrin and metalloproteinase with thrombospondin motifs adt-1-like n=1 Tax=Dysidea avara TaxID=196820 RepID=UPI003317B266
MTDRTVLFASLLVMLCYLTVQVTSQSQIIQDSWSAWTCTSDTEASRTRITANCTTMNVFDSVTNMTNITTSCVNSTDMETMTDVVSQSLSWSMWSPVLPSCGTTRMISQSRAIQCSVVNPECSVTCNPREATRTEDIPLCCTALPWNQWTTWTSTMCSSVTATQTRQRTRDRTSCVSAGDCEDSCVDGTESRTVSPTTWSVWGNWSLPGEQLCANGQRFRQRTCPNDSVLYCEFECPVGDVQSETDCCIVQYQWTTWSTWAETPNSDCPSIRTRRRTCTVDASAVTRNVTRAYPCSTTCTLDSVDTVEEDFFPERCVNVDTGDDGFPVWAIAVISAVGVVVVVGGFVVVTIIGRTLARRQAYSIGEATIAAQKEYERMHEPTAAGDAGYRPTDSFNFHPSGIPPAQESYDSYEEKQF